jgi:hypothetical protein
MVILGNDILGYQQSTIHTENNGQLVMKIWVVMAKVEELQARSVDKVFDSKEKAEQYSEGQNRKEMTQFVNIGGIDRSIEEWDVE